MDAERLAKLAGVELNEIFRVKERDGLELQSSQLHTTGKLHAVHAIRHDPRGRKREDVIVQLDDDGLVIMVVPADPARKNEKLQGDALHDEIDVRPFERAVSRLEKRQVKPSYGDIPYDELPAMLKNQAG